MFQRVAERPELLGWILSFGSCCRIRFGTMSGSRRKRLLRICDPICHGLSVRMIGLGMHLET